MISPSDTKPTALPCSSTSGAALMCRSTSTCMASATVALAGSVYTSRFMMDSSTVRRELSRSFSAALARFVLHQRHDHDEADEAQRAG